MLDSDISDLPHPRRVQGFKLWSGLGLEWGLGLWLIWISRIQGSIKVFYFTDLVGAEPQFSVTVRVMILWRVNLKENVETHYGYYIQIFNGRLNNGNKCKVKCECTMIVLWWSCFHYDVSFTRLKELRNPPWRKSSRLWMFGVDELMIRLRSGLRLRLQGLGR